MIERDKLLTEAIQEGDEDAFENLFFKYYETLCQFADQYVASMAIAEELVQEVYANIWESRSELGKLENIRTYLYKSVKNQALDYLKHEEVIQKYERQVELELYDEVYKTDEERVNKEDFVEAAQRAIEELPEHTGHIYKLSRKDGLTYTEIAKILEVSTKTIEYHISKALRILRDRLSPYLPILLILFFYEIGA